MKATGTFDGTGADLYLGIGFIPDWVKVYNLETATFPLNHWSKDMRSAEVAGGKTFNDTPGAAANASQVGIGVFRGGNLIEAASTVYLVRDPLPDKRASGAGAEIDKWTLDTAANRTGHWNDVCNTTYVGEGSRICIDGKWYTVEALTSNGEAADEVTLSEAAPSRSGVINALHGMFDFIGASAGQVMPAGFFLDSTAEANIDDALCFFEAGNHA